MDNLTTFSTRLYSLIFAAALLIGCNNPASNDDDHEEHSDPDRMEFIIDGESIASYTYSNDSTEGHFDLQEGAETSVTVEFFAEDGDEIHGEDLDEEYSLAWEIANPDIANIEQHDEDGRWSFHVAGKTSGETTVQFKLMHGNHADFRTPGVDENNALEIHVGEHSH